MNLLSQINLLSRIKQLRRKKKLMRQLSLEEFEEFDDFELVTKDKKGNYIFDEKYGKRCKYKSIKEIGEEKELVYVTFANALPKLILREMTILRYKNSMDANAVYINYNKWQRIDDLTAKIYFQPLKIK
jgi:hypothetical protein